jgi:hypothetical protein
MIGRKVCSMDFSAIIRAPLPARLTPAGAAFATPVVIAAATGTAAACPKTPLTSPVSAACSMPLTFTPRASFTPAAVW